MCINKERVMIMEFKDLRDAKALMINLAEKVDKSNKYYNDFIWFSSINYTTSSEYHGELKLFIQSMIDQNDIPAMKQEVNDLYKWLSR